MRANAQAWQHMALLPRVMRPLAGGHTRVNLLGREWPHPILVAPMAYQRLAHPHGEQATALAVAALGAGLMLSTQASTLLEDVARAFLPEVDRGPLWFQLYLLPDRGFMRALVQRAEAAGFEALVLTVDAPVQGARDRERRAGFRRPADVTAVNLAGRVAPVPLPLRPGRSSLFDDLMTHAPTWDDIAWLRSITPLPVLIKGVVHPAEARQALNCGTAGLIASNHGGRTLDTMPATATLLPRVLQAVAGDAPVVVDGGIRRGTDVLKALALGAHFVFVGRPFLYAAVAGGQPAVERAITLLHDEIHRDLALMGIRSLSEITPDLVRKF